MPAMWTIQGVVRLRSAPAYDPPYDDECPPERWGPGPGVVQPLLELAAPPVAREPDRPGWRRAPAPATASPATTAAATRFVNTCLEILNGYRAITHVRVLAHPFAAPVVLSEMSRAVQRLRRAARDGGDQLVKLRTMRTCEPRPRVAEIAVVVGRASGTGCDTWALAFRLEQAHGRWLCTAAALL
jgi:Family of unknown function (DUF6459)